MANGQIPKDYRIFEKMNFERTTVLSLSQLSSNPLINSITLIGLPIHHLMFPANETREPRRIGAKRISNKKWDKAIKGLTKNKLARVEKTDRGLLVSLVYSTKYFENDINGLNLSVGAFFLSRIWTLLFNIKTPVFKKVLDFRNLRL